MPNADAWMRAKGAFGDLIVVSDGVGSCPHARHGAKCACEAVVQSVKKWSKLSGGTPTELITQIEPTWQRLVLPFPPGASKATCLFALKRPDGNLLIGGLGDGMAVIKRGGEDTEWIHGQRGDNFSNNTRALGQNLQVSNWTLQDFRVTGEAIVLLATDGISDDLIPDRVDDFVIWLLEEFGAMPPLKRWHSLRRELREWPTPHHIDDKTLVILWMKESAASHE